MNRPHPSLIAVAIIAYCAWNARTLIEGWKSAPFEKHAWLLFFIWCLPILYYWITKSSSFFSGNPLFLGVAISLSFIGQIGAINFAKYLGFASALAALIPWRSGLLLWLISSLAWMPAFGWFASHYFYDSMFLIRGIVCTIGLISGMMNVNKGVKHG